METTTNIKSVFKKLVENMWNHKEYKNVNVSERYVGTISIINVTYPFS